MTEAAFQSFSGSYPPLVTPIVDEQVDYEAFARLVEFQVASGSHGVVVCGTSGEPSLLTVAERKQLAATAVEAAAGRLTVLIATGTHSLADTSELTSHAGEIGADGVLVVTPYFVRPPARGLVEYYRRVGSLTDLPLFLYHIPMRAGTTVTVETLAEIRSVTPTFAGMKHTAPDLPFVSTVRAELGHDFKIFAGLEDLSFPMMAIGATGMINAIGNVVPAELVKVCEAVRDSRLDDARQLHDDLRELNEVIFWDTNPIAMKYLLKVVGLLETNEHRIPMAPATKELEARLDALAEKMGLVELAKVGV